MRSTQVIGIRKYVVYFLFIFLSGCAVASLSGTAVNKAVKVVEVPIKVVGAVVSSNDDEEGDEE